MAIALTTQPSSDDLQSAYLPIKFVATETANNPDYLTFTIKTSAGASVDGVPAYRAPNIGNEYFFDASRYLKSILDVRTSQGQSTTAIEDLTDIYGHYEVEVSDTINSLTSLTSNHFFAFAFKDNVRYSNDQTANNGCSNKVLLYGSDVKTNGLFPTKIRTEQDRVILWRPSGVTDRLYVDTYSVNNPNASSTVLQSPYHPLTGYSNQLISVPLNSAFIISDFTYSGVLINYKGYKLRYQTTKGLYYHYNDLCNTSSFMFINRYGAKEVITFKSRANRAVTSASEFFRNADFTHTGESERFNTSADAAKYNQSTSETIKIEGQKMPSNRVEELKDFVSSPKCWIIGTDLIPVLVTNGTYELLKDGRGVEFNFNYTYSQKAIDFV